MYMHQKKCSNGIFNRKYLSRLENGTSIVYVISLYDNA